MVEIQNGSEPPISRQEVGRRLAVRRDLAMSKTTLTRVTRTLRENREGDRELRRLLREQP